MKKILKKYLALIVALAMVFSCFSTGAFATEGTTEENASVSYEDYSTTENPPTEETEDYIEWSFDEETKTLTVNGKGEMPDYDNFSSAPWLGFYEEVEKLVVGEGITKIGGSAFSGLFNLKEAVLPETLTVIGSSAFLGCINLSKINLPDSIEGIGTQAFFGVELDTLTVPKNITGEVWLFEAYMENLIIPKEVGDANIVIINANTKNIVNYSPTAIVDVDEAGEYLDDEYVKFFKVYQKFVELAVEAERAGKEGITEHKLMMEAFSSVFGIDASTDEKYNEAVQKWEYEIATLYCPDSFYINCLEESEQHNYCRNNVVNHKIIGSDELCECFAFEGYDENGNHFVIDRSTGTAIISGSGQLSCKDVGRYNNYFDTVAFSEDSAFTILGFDTFRLIDIEDFDIPDTIEILETYLFRYSKIKNITIPVSVVQIDEATFIGCYNLENVYYEGSYEQWKEINIDKDNDYNKWLFDANLYFNGVLHKHTVVKGETVAPTCSSEGYTVYECECGYSYKDDYTAASTHTDENTDYICDVCGSEIDKTVTDDESGIIFETKDEADFTVVEIEDKNDLDYVLVESLINGGLAGLYDIKMIDSEGNPVQPESTVKVKLPVGDAEGPFSIYRVEENGTLTNMNAYRDGEYMVFVTDHFSLYVLVDENVTEDEETTDENVKEDCGEDCDCLCHTHKLLRLIFIILNIVMKYLDVEPLCNC